MQLSEIKQTNGLMQQKKHKKVTWISEKCFFIIKISLYLWSKLMKREPCELSCWCSSDAAELHLKLTR